MSSEAKPVEKRKRVHLSIKQKLQLIKRLESGVSVSKVCEEFGVKKQTVSDIRKSKNRLQNFSARFSLSSEGNVRPRMTMKTSQNSDLEKAVYEWFVQQLSENAVVCSTDIISAADDFACQMGINHTASAAWLWRFRNRYGLCIKVGIYLTYTKVLIN